MLVHIVMWQFRDGAEGRTRAENCAYIKSRLEELPAVIPFIRKFEIGINAFPGEMAADMVLVSEFDSKADLDAYTVHPAHKEVSEYVAKVRSSRFVTDYLR